MSKLRWEGIELGPIIGVGTVGTVYRATIQQTGEVVAIKVLQEAVSRDALVKRRFEREMMILQRLNHPNIIRYLGGGNHENQLFYAMELVDGGTVKELLQRFDRVSWMEVASCAKQVCSALQHAHNHGIIHRDLKPGNLFLTRGGEIKLGDFGIARDTRSADLTVEGYTVGTHAYMSPEQITGSPNVTGKVDLYALGCVLFEMLTARKPFDGTNFAVLFEQHLHQPPPRVRDFISDCPLKLDEVIHQLLEKDPEQRPFNARAVQGIMIQLLQRVGASPAFRRANRGDEGGQENDVSAAGVLDPGTERLSRRLSSVAVAPQDVSWTKLAVLSVVTFVILIVVVFCMR